MLSELCRQVDAERALVEASEAQLHSLQEKQEIIKPIADLEQRLSECSLDIIAKRNEVISCEAEYQKMMTTNEQGCSNNIDRLRYLFFYLDNYWPSDTLQILLLAIICNFYKNYHEE